MKRKRQEKKTRSQGKRDNANKKRQAILDNPPTNMRIADRIALVGLKRVGYEAHDITGPELYCDLTFQPFYILDRLNKDVDQLKEQLDEDVPPAWVPGWYEDKFTTGVGTCRVAFFVRDTDAFIFFGFEDTIKPVFGGVLRLDSEGMPEIAVCQDFAKSVELEIQSPADALAEIALVLWIAMKLLACSNSAELITDGPPRTNATKAYAAARKCTLPDYRPKVVDLWLPRSPGEALEPQGGVGSKQRFHTRCGHIKRIMKGGERVTIYIAPYTAGDRELGIGPRKRIRAKQPA